MTEVAMNSFRPLGPGDAIPNDFVVPYYLDDRKLRISVARVAGRLEPLGVVAGVAAVSLDGDHDVAWGERGDALGARRRDRGGNSGDGCDTDEKPGF